MADEVKLPEQTVTLKLTVNGALHLVDVKLSGVDTPAPPDPLPPDPPVPPGPPTPTPAPAVPATQPAAHGESVPIAVSALGGPTHWTAESGVWANGQPGAGARVAVSHQMTITGDLSCGCLVILPGGALVLSGGSVSTIETLQILPGGSLEHRPGATLRLGGGALDSVNDPERWWQGLNCWGEYTALGTVKTSWLRLVREPQAGDTSLVFSGPAVGWRAGDLLVLGDSEQKFDEGLPGAAKYTSKTERVSVASVAADGLSCALSSPLSYTHLAARDPDGTVNRFPPVGNLSRACVVESADPKGVRAHAVFTGASKPDLVGVEWRRLGRTTHAPISTNNPKRQYAGPHFHHLDNSDPSLFVVPDDDPAKCWRFRMRNCSVWDDDTGGAFGLGRYRWGVTLHASHYGEVSGNVVHNVSGAGIVTEAGSETGNLITNNLIVTSTGDHNRPDERGYSEVAFEGAGLWLHGFLNYVEGNEAIDCRFGAMVFPETGSDPVNQTVPAAPGAAATVVVEMVQKAFLSFRNNALWGGLMADGLQIWSHGTNRSHVRTGAEHSLVEGLFTAHCYAHGIFSYDCHNITYRGWVHRGNNTLTKLNVGRVGYYVGDYLQLKITLEDCDVRGEKYGVGSADFSGPDASQAAPTFKVQGGTFQNLVNFYFNHPWSSGSVDNVRPRTMVYDGTNHLALPYSVSGEPPSYDYQLLGFSTLGATNYRVLDLLLVYNHNGTPGDNFRLYYHEQTAGSTCPADSPGPPAVLGCPEPGLTNQQSWDKYGIALGGEVAPLTVTVRPRVYGLTNAATLPATAAGQRRN